MPGYVLVEYVVFADGHVGDIRNRSPESPVVFFDAVADWLKGCTYEPSRKPTGEAVAVKMVQPFKFKRE